MGADGCTVRVVPTGEKQYLANWKTLARDPEKLIQTRDLATRLAGSSDLTGRRR